MIITALEVDGYGVWSGLKLGELSDGLNVFYGPNEAGKTTLMQFVRSVLYGFAAERRRYLPPLRGGRPGGSVDVVGPNGRFHISRHQHEDPSGTSEVLALSAGDGTQQGEHLLKVLLCNIDAPLFNNVFAVGLKELQELGTLSDTDAASLLYRLSAGLDRVALVDVVRELEASRNRLLGGDGQPSQLGQLVAKRDQLRADMEQLHQLTRRYTRLAAERDQLQRETTRLEEETTRLRYQSRVIEIAMALGDRWQRRRQLDDQLLALGPVETMPDGTVDRLEALGAALAKRRQYVERLKLQDQQLRSEAAGLKINEPLWRLAPQIEALQEQESWIDTLRGRAAELESEIADLEAQLAREQERFGLGGATVTDQVSMLSARSLVALRQPAKALRQCRQRLQQAQQKVASARQTAASLADEISAALSARGQRTLSEAMDRTGGLVAQLRRRVQLDERLAQMDRHQTELEGQSRRLLARQVLPLGVLLALGGVFVVSVVLMMAGLFMPESITGSLGWPLALLGLGGLGAAVATKVVLERSNARRLDSCQKQIGMLQLQIKQAKQERESLDEQLPEGGSAVASRLQAAEEELSKLEELVPSDARRKAAQQEAEAAAARARQAQSDWDAARRSWQQTLEGHGLPKRLSPKQVRLLATRSHHIGEIQRRLESRREESAQRRRELDALTSRIAQLASGANLTFAGDDPIEQVRALAEQLAEQEARIQRRQALRTEARRVRRKRAKLHASIRRLKHRRREILRGVGANDEDEVRQRAVLIARQETLRRQRQSLQAEIDAAIAKHCPEQAVAELLEADPPEPLQQRHQELKDRLEAAEAKLQEQFEQRGRLSEQLKALAEERSPAGKQLELALVEKRLEEAIHRWRVLAVSSRILKTIRATYEQERQPETLQEASGYLEHLTQGRYVRVWTPLEEDALLVDDARRDSHAIEVLSRGTREQLFLCLRLALAASFARRGAQLPMLLDDVLVNFDSGRAKAAVALLREFAAAGHQLFVFTCHEHIAKLFTSLRVPVSRLPDSAEPGASDKPQRKRPKRKSKPRRSARELVAGPASQDSSGDPSEEANQDKTAKKSRTRRSRTKRADRDEQFLAWPGEEPDQPEEPLTPKDEAPFADEEHDRSEDDHEDDEQLAIDEQPALDEQNDDQDEQRDEEEQVEDEEEEDLDDDEDEDDECDDEYDEDEEDDRSEAEAA